MPSSGEAALTRARALHEEGRAENSAGRPARGARLLRRALKALDADRSDEMARTQLRARVMLSLAWSETHLVGPDRGLAVIDDVVELIGPDGGSEEVRTALHNQRGLMYWRAGRMAESLKQFDEAERWFAAAPPVERCNVLLNRGTIRMDSSDLDGSRRDLSTCAQLAKENDLPLVEQMARHNLGYLEFLAGDLPRAVHAMEEAADAAGPVPAGVPLLDRARVLLEAGLSRDADDALAEAAEIFHRDGMTYELAETMLARAQSALRQGHYQRAHTFAAKGRQLFRRRGNRRWESLCTLTLLGADLAIGKSGRLILRACQDLASALDECNLPGEARSARLLAAELMLGTGDIDGAREVVAEAATPRPDDRISLRLHGRYVRARIDVASHQPARAVEQIKTGFAELAEYQAKFGSLDLQSAGSLHGQRLAAVDLSIAFDGGRVAQIFAAAERARAASSRMTAVRPPADDQAAALLSQLRKVVEAQRAVDVDSATLVELRNQRAVLERRIKARHWTMSGDGHVQRPISLASLHRELGSVDGELVMFLRSKGILHALVVRAGAATVRQIGDVGSIVELTRRIRADLDVLAIGQIPTPLLSTALASLRKSLTAMDEFLIAPLALRAGAVVIVPSGALATVPWGMLPRLSGRPIVVAQSATSWLHARRTNLPTGRAGSPSTVALAGPGLNRAKYEAEAVAKIWPGCVSLTGDDATGAALRDGLRSARIVHVAAHGQHEPDNPLFSCIRLADGPLFAYDLVADVGEGVHVVLSACDLGLATVRPGEEALGLTRALLHHGAATVVSGVARVADDVAAEVMAQYHSLLASGVAPANALAQVGEHAQAAPFVCFGSGLRPIVTA